MTTLLLRPFCQLSLPWLNNHIFWPTITCGSVILICGIAFAILLTVLFVLLIVLAVTTVVRSVVITHIVSIRVVRSSLVLRLIIATWVLLAPSSTVASSRVLVAIRTVLKVTLLVPALIEILVRVSSPGFCELSSLLDFLISWFLSLANSKQQIITKCIKLPILTSSLDRPGHILILLFYFFISRLRIVLLELISSSLISLRFFIPLFTLTLSLLLNLRLWIWHSRSGQGIRISLSISNLWLLLWLLAAPLVPRTFLSSPFAFWFRLLRKVILHLLRLWLGAAFVTQIYSWRRVITISLTRLSNLNTWLLLLRLLRLRSCRTTLNTFDLATGRLLTPFLFPLLLPEPLRFRHLVANI